MAILITKGLKTLSHSRSKEKKKRMVDFTVLGIHIGTGAIIGLGAGLGTWMLEDAIAEQITKKNWVLPLMGALSASGAYFLFVARA